MLAAIELPHTEVFKFSDPPDEKGVEVQFRLIYRGPLHPVSSGKGGTRKKEKHAIRKQFHHQLKELWEQNVFLRKLGHSVLTVQHGDGPSHTQTQLEILANNWNEFGYRFVPLVSKKFGLACSIDVLFLRRDSPGNLIQSSGRGAGDLDNRITTLFDALRKPENAEEIDGFPPEADEDPFYCLMETDRLVTDVSVTTDRLLLPMESGMGIHDVLLIVFVKTSIVDFNKTYIEFLNE